MCVNPGKQDTHSSGNTLWCTHCPFLWLCMCCPPHHTHHFIKLNWFGCACRVWKGTNILKVIHFGYAPVAVKGTDGGMRWLRCLGHIGCLEKVFQQRFLYATLIFQDVSVSVNKHFECIMFTSRWRKKYTPFCFLCNSLERKRMREITVFRFQTFLPWAIWSQQSAVGQVLCLLKALCN